MVAQIHLIFKKVTARLSIIIHTEQQWQLKQQFLAFNIGGF